MREELVSSLDYAGIKKLKHMFGSSLRVFFQTGTTDPSWRNGLFLENLDTGRDTPLQIGYVQDGWKYIGLFKAPHPYRESDVTGSQNEPVFEMLFDLTNDLQELNNLIESPKTIELAARLRKHCAQSVADLNKRRTSYKWSFLE